MFKVSYCDSQNYSKIVDSINTDYFRFISNIVKNGITSATYSTRADIIMLYLDPEIRSYSMTPH